MIICDTRYLTAEVYSYTFTNEIQEVKEIKLLITKLVKKKKKKIQSKIWADKCFIDWI